MAQQVNSFGFLKGSGSGGGGTNTNIANTDLTQDDNRTLDGDGNDLIFTGQSQMEFNSAIDFKNGTSAPDIKIYEASGGGTNYVQLTIDAVSSNRTIKFPISDDTTLAGLAVRQTFTDRNIVNIREFEITSSTDGNCIGDIVYFGSTSVIVGRVYYWDGSGWTSSDASTEGDGSKMMAVSLDTGTASSVGMCIRGMVTLSTDSGDAGDILYLSETANQVTSTAPTTSGSIVRVMGYCMDDTDGQIWFDPDGSWVENA
jgi:hypothetical protein